MTYAVPNKPERHPQIDHDDDDKYMNIGEIETADESNYENPDPDEAQPYNSYATPDEPRECPNLRVDGNVPNGELVFLSAFLLRIFLKNEPTNPAFNFTGISKENIGTSWNSKFCLLAVIIILLFIAFSLASILIILSHNADTASTMKPRVSITNKAVEQTTRSGKTTEASVTKRHCVVDLNRRKYILDNVQYLGPSQVN